MIAFVQCFRIVSQIGVASIRNLMSSFGKASEPFCTDFRKHLFDIFKLLENWNQVFIFSYPRPAKCVFGPGDVLACPIIYGFVYQSANVPQILSDPPQKLIVHTFPSIWH